RQFRQPGPRSGLQRGRRLWDLPSQRWIVRRDWQEARMRQSVGLGRVAGIPVGMHWTVAVILVIIAEILGASVLPAALPHQPAVVYWAAAAAAALVFAGSLLAHELAHSLVAQRNGCGCARSRC